jgi:hypothetical protein
MQALPVPELSMPFLHRFVSSSLVVFAASLTLTGCSGLDGMPQASANPEQGALGTIQGNDFGGHAPLVGAHVYVLQPGTTGYGSQATSLLTSSYSNNGANNPASVLNVSDPGVPTTWYYQTTDSTGAFNISGDYTCTVGQPVYLYLYGGSPVFPSASNVFALATSASSNTLSTVVSNGTDAIYTYTVASTSTTYSVAPENFYIGEQVTMTGFPTASFNASGNVANPANTAHWITVSGTTYEPVLSTTQFSIYGATSLAEGVYDAPADSTSTPIVTAVPTFNPAVVNLAVLGNCPSGAANAGFGSSIKYVYVNEVSTTAAAFAFQGFTVQATGASTVVNNNATYIGTSATNLVGIENAALTAGQLYDIQGSNLSTVYAGEGHIARQFTPNGNGVVPQAMLDDIGNILAGCVDTNNTATTLGTGGGQGTNMSTQCSTLFATASNTGVPVSSATAPGLQPFDTAQAAIHIARFPSGSGTAAQQTSFVTSLFNMPTGNVPFAPTTTTAPNDFGIAILYPSSKTVSSTTVTNSYVINPESISVDAGGNVWFDNAAYSTTSHSIIEWSPLGVLLHNTAYNGSQVSYVAIDPTGNAWSSNATNNSASKVTEINSGGTFISTGAAYNTGFAPYSGTTGYTTYLDNGYADSVDGNGAFYAADGNTGNGYRLTQLSANATASSGGGVATTGTYETNAIAAMATCFGNGADSGASGSPDRHVDHMAVDSKANGYNVWLTSEGFGTNSDGVICKINASGSLVTGFTTSLKGITTTSTSDEFPSIDSSGNAWVPSGYNATPVLLEISPSGGYTRYNTGATLSDPFGSTIDGNNTVWVADRGNGTIANFNIAAAAFASPAKNYFASGSTTSLSPSYLNIAADPSGNLWATDNSNSNIVEFIGIAAPAYTPLSRAALNNAIGTKP